MTAPCWSFEDGVVRCGAVRCGAMWCSAVWDVWCGSFNGQFKNNLDSTVKSLSLELSKLGRREVYG